MAFYAPRGITPEEIRQMSPVDRTILRAGWTRFYDDEIRITQAGVACAFEPPKGDDSGEE